MFGKLSRKLLRPLVPIIRIKGDINFTTTYLIGRSLAKISPGRSDALGLVIDSDGGSPVQCEIILTKIRQFCDQHHLPLYTFAEDKALSAGYWMLCVGDKVYADKSSAVGNVGTTVTHTGVRDLFKDHNIEVRTWVSDENKIIPSLYNEVNDTQKLAMQNWADTVRKNFIAHIEKHRSSKIKVPEGERDEKLYQGKVWTGEEIANFGLVDGIGTYASVFYRDFPKSRIVDVSEAPAFEKYQDNFRSIVKIWTSKALPWILAYVTIRMCIRIYILFLIFRKKDSTDPKDQEDVKKLEQLDEKIPL